MRAESAVDDITVRLSRHEALVLFEMLQRLVDDDETKLLPLLHSSAEFAVLCRINNHLEKTLPEPLLENYDDLLKAARASIIRQSGRYLGIEEV